MLKELAKIKKAKTGRFSSWDTTGRNQDFWQIPAKSSAVLADIKGPGCITHIWMTQGNHYRECLLKITYDNAKFPSVLVPLGDFFCLGHSLVNSFCSLPFTASTNSPYKFGAGCALNCYLPMPFRKHAKIEITNEDLKKKKDELQEKITLIKELNNTIETNNKEIELKNQELINAQDLLSDKIRQKQLVIQLQKMICSQSPHYSTTLNRKQKKSSQTSGR